MDPRNQEQALYEEADVPDMGRRRFLGAAAKVAAAGALGVSAAQMLGCQNNVAWVERARVPTGKSHQLDYPVTVYTDPPGARVMIDGVYHTTTVGNLPNDTGGRVTIHVPYTMEHFQTFDRAYDLDGGHHHHRYGRWGHHHGGHHGHPEYREGVDAVADRRQVYVAVQWPNGEQQRQRVIIPGEAGQPVGASFFARQR